MSVPPVTDDLGARLPTAGEQASANQLRMILATLGEGKLCVLDQADNSQHEIALPPALVDMLVQLLSHIEAGEAVRLVREIQSAPHAGDLP